MTSCSDSRGRSWSASRAERRVGVRAGRQREQRGDALAVQRADEGGHPLPPAHLGQGVGDAGRAGLRAKASWQTGQPDHDRDQGAAGDRDSERPRPGLGLALVGVAVAEEGGQDGPVGLPLQALLPVIEQPAEGEGRRGALDQGHVAGRWRAAAQHDQPAQSSPRAPTTVMSQPEAVS